MHPLEGQESLSFVGRSSFRVHRGAEGLALGVAFDSHALDGLRLGPALLLVRNAGSAVRVGLSIVNRIAEAAGGKVSIDSRLGSGSTFAILLPLAAPDGEDRTTI